MDLAIIVVGYYRLDSVKRITSSILASSYSKDNITLYYSLDYSNHQDSILKYLDTVTWKYGDVEVIVHPSRLGLREHILKCGDLSQNHDAIILLEDDLYVSKDFYNYATQSLNFYKDETRVAGIALYAAQFIEIHEMSFMPLKSKWDSYFMQIPCSWGQAWTREQWTRFRDWYNQNNTDEIFRKKIIPEDVLLWPKTSWKKFYYQYMVEKNLYFTYPYDSHTTNFSDIGENIDDKRTFLQVELSQKKGIDYLFQDYNDSMIKYDHVGEPLAAMFTSLNQTVNLDDLTVDLYGNKDLENVKTEYILTSKLASEPIRSFARKLKPHELNIIQNISGNEIRLAKISNCENKKKYRKSELSYYYSIPTYHLNPHDLRHYKNLLSVKYKMSYLKIIFGYPIYLKFLSLKRKISNYISNNIYK